MSGHRSGLPSNHNLLQEHTPYLRHSHGRVHGHVHHFRFRHHPVCAGSTLNISFFALLGIAVILLSILVAYVGIWVHQSRTAGHSARSEREDGSEEESLFGVKGERSSEDDEVLPPYEAPPSGYQAELVGVIVERMDGDVKE